MTVSEVIIDLSEYSYPEHSYDDNIIIEPAYIEDIAPRIESLTVSPCPVVVVQAPGAPEPPTGCTATVKYEGNTVTLQATPRNGTGPYYVEFRKNDVALPGNDPLGRPYTIPSATEDTQLTRTYVLTNEDIRTASTGTIDFSVYISDSCPTGAKTCESICTVNIGCLAPVCNFTVT